MDIIKVIRAIDTILEEHPQTIILSQTNSYWNRAIMKPRHDIERARKALCVIVESNHYCRDVFFVISPLADLIQNLDIFDISFQEGNFADLIKLRITTIETLHLLICYLVNNSNTQLLAVRKVCYSGCL